jgi:hypothetical protein
MERERIKLYEEFIDVVMDTMTLSASQKKQHRAIMALGVKLQKVGLRMLVVSSDDVIWHFLRWRNLSREDQVEHTVEAFSKLMHVIRKEMIPTTERTPVDALEILT